MVATVAASARSGSPIPLDERRQLLAASSVSGEAEQRVPGLERLHRHALASASSGAGRRAPLRAMLRAPSEEAGRARRGW